MRNPAEIISKYLELFWARLVASALSGLLLFACFPSLDLKFLVWVAVLPLLLALAHERRLGRAFWEGYLAGAIFLAGSCYWFVYVMRRYGDLSLPLAVGVLFLFVVVFSTLFGAFAALEASVARRSIGFSMLLAPFLWVTLEIARTYVLTGFPWNLLGYAVGPVGLRQWAASTGVYGLSFLAMAVTGLMAWTLARPAGRRLLVFGTVVIGLVSVNYAAAPASSATPTNLAVLVQPNIPLDEITMVQWIPWRNPGGLRELLALSESTRASLPNSPRPPLIIWSENPAPFYFDRDAVFHAAMVNLAKTSGAYIISGTTTFVENTNRPRNSAVVLDPQGRTLLVYDKIHLVPFGEYVPWWAFPGKVQKLTFDVGDFAPGTRYDIASTPEGGIAVFICYEAIFPQLVRRLVAKGGGVLVNISDDGWFGHSSAAAQHLNMARMRAIENHRWLLRSTNDGITAVIDPYGRVVARLPRYQRTALPAHFSYLTRETFYTRHGDIFAWACVAVAAGMLLLQSASGRRQQGSDEMHPSGVGKETT